MSQDQDFLKSDIKKRIKKRIKGKINKNLTLDDFRKAGKGYANIVKAFTEGMAEVME